ncbi:MAG TPA: MFS transporter [Actinomycetota bacterium]|nr:MFS transporter [Actinomycetota bacterium]
MKPGMHTRGPLIALLSSSGVSMAGNVIAGIAVPWFVLRTTGSATRAGFIAAMSFLPTVVASLFGGVLIDRLGFKRTSVLADVLSGVTVAAIPLLHATVGIEFWQLAMLVFTGSLLDAPGVIAREALVPRLAEDAGMSIERGTASIQVVERSSRLAGAPLAGLIIAAAGAPAALWINAASFLVSAVAVAVAVPGSSLRSDGRGRYWAEMREGLGFVWRDPVIRWIGITVMVTNLLDAPLYAVVLPVLAERIYDSPVVLGLMLGAAGGGAVVGALLFGWRGSTIPRRRVFVGGFATLAAFLWVLIAFPPVPVLVAVMAVKGVAAGPLNPVIMAIQFERVPERLRGRVFGATLALSWASIPAGTITAGWLIERAGIRTVMIAIAVAYLLWTAGMAANPVFRRLDESRRIPASEGSL